MRKLLLAGSLLTLVAATANAQPQERDGYATKLINLYPGMAVRIVINRPYKSVFVGDDRVIEAMPGDTNTAVIVKANPGEGGSSNLIIADENGELIATYRVTTRPEGQWFDEAPIVCKGVLPTDEGYQMYYDNAQACHHDASLIRKPRKDDTKATSTTVTTTEDRQGNVTTSTTKTYDREGPK